VITRYWSPYYKDKYPGTRTREQLVRHLTNLNEFKQRHAAQCHSKYVQMHVSSVLYANSSWNRNLALLNYHPQHFTTTQHQMSSENVCAELLNALHINTNDTKNICKRRCQQFLIVGKIHTMV